MKIHVLGIPHTVTSKDFLTCAFTQKVLKLCAMMRRRGHTVIHYGVEGSDVEATEHVSLVTRAELDAAYPHPGTEFYKHADVDGPRAAYLEKWKESLKTQLRLRVGRPNTEIIAMTWGGPQRDACAGIPQFQVESGIGYPITFADYRVYESYAWLHMNLGRDNLYGGEKWYWAVIPNAFEVKDFRFRTERGEDLLYIGRLNHDKGVGLAVHVAHEVGRKITIVGQGDPTPFLEPHVTYLPPVNVAERARLLSECAAVICPTFYVEPFAGVNVEAQLSGAPVITTDWGAFTETVLHGRTGYRCRTFEQFVWAAKNIGNIDPLTCRDWARENYSMERVALMYEEFFQQVLNVRENKNGKVEGFYLRNPNRTELDWMYRVDPSVSNDNSLLYFPDLTRPHVEPPPPEVKGEWETAQDWERDWWGLTWTPRWDEEIRKQEGDYFRLMGMPPVGLDGYRDFGSRSVLDVGCGPVSLLQRSKHGPSRGIDPLAVSDETRKRYQDCGVEFLNIKAEDMPLDREFDEVWMYNCLLHTEDPDAIMAGIAVVGKSVRIFEWIDIDQKYEGHPQIIHEDLFLRHLPETLFERRIWSVGTLRDEHGCWTKYIAIHAVKKAQPSAEEVKRLIAEGRAELASPTLTARQIVNGATTSA